MHIDIENIEIKPLIANLGRIKIEEYLRTDDFNHLVLEYDFDKFWGLAKKNIENRNIFIGRSYSEVYEAAFQWLLDALWERRDKKRFYQLLEITLIDYIRWHKGDTDLTKVLKSLAQLEMPHDQLDRLKNAQKTQGESDRAATAKREFKGSKVEIDNVLCFVIMPLAEEFDSVYRGVIEPVVAGLKLKCLRADEIFTPTPIIDDICEHIRKARFLIADLTHRNPNVFYELGFAHALDKAVILLTQDLKDVPFDLKHRRIIPYRDGLGEAKKIKKELSAFINELIGDSKSK